MRQAVCRIIAAAALSLLTFTIVNPAAAQSRRYRFINGAWTEITDTIANKTTPDSTVSLVADSTIDVSRNVFPRYFYMPAVFDTYDMNLGHDSIADFPQTADWADNVNAMRLRSRRFAQSYMIGNPELVRYNIATLPEAPKKYRAVVDPTKASITVEEINVSQQEVQADIKPVEVKRRNWIHDFTGLVQFSQAYVSPNWYQGGNNNLNMIVNGVWNVKLNPAFHPNLLFENTVAYKLALNSAPDDSLRNYSISEDLFQINSKFGVKALKNWYYSVTLQFKTQLLNNYKTNTRDLTAAFLSPSELNIGLGMTYSAKGKRYDFNASIAPLSYNLKTCTNSRINPENFGIEAGHTSVSQFGSNIDCKLVWNIAYNITLTSRLTAFTNYSYIQGDWENTIAFTINKFLSTQIYAHLRYDSQGSRFEESNWRKWQIKEILSFGFAYKIGTV